MNDPIRELLEALDADGKPSLAWLVRWSVESEEPVRAAWQRSWSPPHMVRLLRLGNDARADEAQRLATAPTLFDSTDGDRVRANAIRALVPTPPPLETLMRHARGAMRFAGVDEALLLRVGAVNVAAPVRCDRSP